MAIVNATYGGYFEYDGIYKAWNASVQSTDKQNTIVSYFHSKGRHPSPIPTHLLLSSFAARTGGFNHGDGTLIDGRTRTNVFLTKVVMEDWRFILDHFAENKALFHNFWFEHWIPYAILTHTYQLSYLPLHRRWARASYVSGRPEPQYGSHIGEASLPMPSLQ